MRKLTPNSFKILFSQFFWEMMIILVIAATIYFIPGDMPQDEQIGAGLITGFLFTFFCSGPLARLIIRVLKKHIRYSPEPQPPWKTI